MRQIAIAGRVICRSFQPFSRFQMVGLPDFRSRLKSGPFANQPLFFFTLCPPLGARLPVLGPRVRCLRVNTWCGPAKPTSFWPFKVWTLPDFRSSLFQLFLAFKRCTWESGVPFILQMLYFILLRCRQNTAVDVLVGENSFKCRRKRSICRHKERLLHRTSHTNDRNKFTEKFFDFVQKERLRSRQNSCLQTLRFGNPAQSPVQHYP